mgnify:CR=1 FL=1
MKTKNYKSPESIVLDIVPECVLCASYEDDGFNIDDFEKEQGSWD